MKVIKILNLYACLGGNRYKWDEVHPSIDVTAVELDPELARMYQERFPNDTVIIADAHQYLLDHYQEYDFIWSSPPCPTHSKLALSNKGRTKSDYPDMKLYEEVLFLKHYFNGKYCVENVIPYYEPLITAKKRGRHLYWTNFNLPTILSNRKGIGMASRNEIKQWEQFHKINVSEYKGSQRKDKICRNLVDYEDGKIILSMSLKGIPNDKKTQQTIF